MEYALAEHKAYLEAWKNVKRVSKKDGSDFATFGRNFEDARVEQDTWIDCERIKVNAHSGCAWVEDSIDLVRDAEGDISEERVFEYYGKKKYHLTVDETFEAINNRIRYYEVEIENDKIQIAHAESICNLVENTMTALYNEVLREIEDAGYNPTCSIDAPSILYRAEEIVRAITTPYIRTKEEDLEVAYRR